MLWIDPSKTDGVSQNGVLAVPTAEQWNSANGQDARQHGQRGDLHLGIQAAHAHHVLLVVTTVNHAARAKKQQRFEERVRGEMEQPGGPATNPQGQHHVTELTHGGIGQDLFDIGHDHGNRRRHKQSDSAGIGDNQKSLGSEQRITAADEVDAGRHHGGGVDQGAHRRRTFHGVRQPNVKRELRRLADAAQENAQASRHQ